VFTHVLGRNRKGRPIARLITLFAFAAVAGTAVAVAAAAGRGNPTDLPMSNLNTQAGKLTTLKTGVSYKASAFPIPVRITPDGAWAGAQWKTTSQGKPAFGWVGIGRPPLDKPRGLIEIETAYGSTPSTATIVARLRTAGGGATYSTTKGLMLAGFHGQQFDGHVFGRFGHVFVPFTPKTGGASPPDHYKLDPGEAFRVIVLDVRGKRVVIFLESFGLPADQFPDFLTSANKLLKSLRFGG
jgi:hypothetical protein